MLVRKTFVQKSARLLSFAATVVALSSCATSKPEPQLVSDGANRDSALPWNEQQKWEQQGQFGPMAERFGTQR